MRQRRLVAFSGGVCYFSSGLNIIELPISEKAHNGKCHGGAVKSINIKLWCFCSTECWFESPIRDTVSLSKTLDHCFYLRMGRKEKGFAPVFLAVAAKNVIAPC